MKLTDDDTMLSLTHSGSRNHTLPPSLSLSLFLSHSWVRDLLSGMDFHTRFVYVRLLHALTIVKSGSVGCTLGDRLEANGLVVEGWQVKLLL